MIGLLVTNGAGDGRGIHLRGRMERTGIYENK
jgi:hypothetical protein